MPSPATTVGPLVIPAPVGATDAPFLDPTADRLLSYVAHWLTWGLDAKVATMTRPPSPAGAVPIANRFTASPADLFLQRQLPALFVYWTGASKLVEYSSVKHVRMRDFTVLYMFERVVNPVNLDLWSGLVPTIDALLCAAFFRMSHPTYRFDANAAYGDDIRFMNSWLDAEYIAGSEGFLKQLPTSSMRDLSEATTRTQSAKAQGGIQEGFPSFSGTVRIHEFVGHDTMIDPDDVLQDGLATIAVSEGADEALPNALVRVLEAPPDGSAQIMGEQD